MLLCLLLDHYDANSDHELNREAYEEEHGDSYEEHEQEYPADHSVETEGHSFEAEEPDTHDQADIQSYGEPEHFSEHNQWHEMDDAVAAGAVVVDVRTQAEYDAGNIRDALLIPVDHLRDRLEEIPAGPVVVHCAVGVRGHIAAQILAQAGREVRNLDGGYRTWAAGQASQSPQRPVPD